MKKTQAILAAAGEGVRLNCGTAKAFMRLKGKPLFVYSLEVFARCPEIDSVVMVVPQRLAEACQLLVREFGCQKVARVVAGGEVRRQSVFNGLLAMDPDTEVVLVHDAARPFISQHLVEETLSICYDGQSAVAAVPVKPTIKRVDSKHLTVLETLDRESLWEIQTPQVFALDLLLRAHQEAPDVPVTDDAYLVERLGEPVRVVRADYKNIKITTPEDILLAEALLRLAEKS